MEKILLTGVAGFIGAKTCEYLLESGAEVVGIDNLNPYYDVGLKEHRLRWLKKYNKFRFHQIDIEDLGALQGLFSADRFEAVINLAARAGVRYSMENPFIYMTTNGQGTLNLLTMMNDHKVKKMVLASTSSLYAGQPMPFREDLPVNTPISPYAASKKAAEVMAYTYHYLYGLDISIVRYFTVYGPAGRPDMSIFRFIKWIDEGVPLEIFGDGSQSRDFTFVDDIAKGTIKAVQPVGYEIINLGGGKNPISINEIISKIEKYLGKKAKIDLKPFHKTDLKETWADITKAQKILGWAPSVGIEEGLKKSMDWYLENKSWVKEMRV
jgi:nucleoside-diphosphate-sugar epimerase